jgi:hypothetical protein
MCRTMARCSTTGSRCSGRCFCGTWWRMRPFPHDFVEGARGVQLAELGLRSWHERRWVDVPELEA